MLKYVFGWIRIGVVKRGVLLFWGAWFAVVALTNLLNALQVLEVLPADFKFVSGNWQWINETMNPLGVSVELQAFLFGGVIVWESLCAGLFFYALLRFRGGTLLHERETLWACSVSLALWCAFQVLDEVFLAFSPEAVHRVIFVETILTMLFFQLMPSEHPK